MRPENESSPLPPPATEAAEHTAPSVPLTDGEIDAIAARILAVYRSAFEELAK